MNNLVKPQPAEKLDHSVRRESLLFRLVSTVAILAMTTSPAWAGYRLIVHKITHQSANGFVVTNELPQGTEWYVLNDEQNQRYNLLSLHTHVETYNDQSAGVNSIVLKNASGKIVAQVEDKGLLGAVYGSVPTTPPTLNYVSGTSMSVDGGATTTVAAVTDNGAGIKAISVTISPTTFSNGGQFILKFAGKVPSQTTALIMNASVSGGAGETNLPTGSLGQVVYDQPGVAGGGEATITIDFSLLAE